MIHVSHEKKRERETEKGSHTYVTIISMIDERSFHGRGMQTNHVQASSLSLLSHPSYVRYLCARVPSSLVHTRASRRFYHAPWHWEAFTSTFDFPKLWLSA